MESLLLTLALIGQVGLRNPQFLAQLAPQGPGIGTPLVFSGKSWTNTTAGASSYITATAFTPTANALLLCAVVNSKSTTPDAPTVTGNNLTWTQVGVTNYFSLGTPLKKLTLFRAMVTNTPTSGSVTSAFAASQSGCCIYVGEFTGADTNGWGSTAIVQTSYNGADSTTYPRITLGSTPATTNAVFACWGNDVNGGWSTTPEATWTEDIDFGYNTPASGMYVMHIIYSTDTTATNNYSSSSSWAGIAVEIKKAP